MSEIEKAAQSLALMVIEYVEGGTQGGTDWRSGLKAIIAKRLTRLSALNVPVPIDLLRNIWAEQYYGVGGEHGIDDTIAQWNLNQVVDILSGVGALPDLDADPKSLSALTSTSGDDEAPVAWRYRHKEWSEDFWNYFTKEPRYREDDEIWQGLYARPQSAAVRDEEKQVLDKPAMVGSTIFRKGVSVSTVISAAQRRFEASGKTTAALHSTQEG